MFEKLAFSPQPYLGFCLPACTTLRPFFLQRNCLLIYLERSSGSACQTMLQLRKWFKSPRFSLFGRLLSKFSVLSDSHLKSRMGGFFIAGSVFCSFLFISELRMTSNLERTLTLLLKYSLENLQNSPLPCDYKFRNFMSNFCVLGLNNKPLRSSRKCGFIHLLHHTPSCHTA
jgi:hypothetical protein